MADFQRARTEGTPLLDGRADVLQEYNSVSITPLENGSLDKPLKHQVGPLELSKRARWTILSGVWLATFLISVNMTLVATLLGSISSEFKSSHQAGWLGTGYLLAVCSFTPLYGRLSNALGRRGANQTALVFTAVGILACGLSRNMEFLIAARFFSGLGGGGLFTSSYVIVADMYSVRERGLASGVAAIFNGLGMGMGGPLGGWISDALGWRWAFLLQLPFFALSSFLTSSSLNYVAPGEGRNAWDALRRVDYAGCLCLLVGVGSFLGFLSLHFNGDTPLRDPLVLTSLSVAIAFSVLFVVVELCVAKEPILPLWLLRQRIPLLVGISNVLVAQCNFTIIYFFPLWFQSVQLTSTSEAGGHLFPTAAAMALGSLFAGWMIKKTGKYKVLNVIFGICPTITAFLIANLQMNSSSWAQWFNIIPLGFGNAVVLQTTTGKSHNITLSVALLAAVEVQHIAVATGFSQLFRGAGQAIAVAASSAILQTKLLAELRARIHGPDAEEIVQRIRHSVSLVASLPPELQRSAREAYATSLRAVFRYAAICAFISFLVRLGIPEISLDREPKNSSGQLSDNPDEES
ncbi:MFS general substrate transporter [Cantharellus anzutake]|uniref:MFS general substrate transporter n=1 Tax=Cantharellus anzutake TaxID=1750568 RepID=UPI001906AEE7|nr:MFS general substrate transporter [Cantharellus anzutake]KAF8312574.1 MFS general substrate transporter [Cantharellus anzutake]